MIKLSLRSRLRFTKTLKTLTRTVRSQCCSYFVLSTALTIVVIILDCRLLATDYLSFLSVGRIVAPVITYGKEVATVLTSLVEPGSMADSFDNPNLDCHGIPICDAFWVGL